MEAIKIAVRMSSCSSLSRRVQTMQSNVEMIRTLSGYNDVRTRVSWYIQRCKPEIAAIEERRRIQH